MSIRSVCEKFLPFVALPSQSKPAPEAKAAAKPENTIESKPATGDIGHLSIGMTASKCVEVMTNLVGGRVDSTTQKVMDIFGGAEGFSQLPELVWKDAFHRGGTGYIDGVKPEHMSHSVMRGVDAWGRPFVAVKVVLASEGSDGKPFPFRKDDVKEGTFTLFQRYTDSLYTWTHGRHFGPEFFNSTLDRDALSRLETLVAGEPVTHISAENVEAEQKYDPEYKPATIKLA